MALKAGAFRFNTDSSQMEIYDGNQWTGILGDSPDLQTGGTRGLWAGGEEPGGKTNRIQYVNVDTTGNTSDFGDANNSLSSHTAFASRTRGLISGGFIGPQPTNYSNVIDFVTISNTGNATDFGDLSVFTGGQRPGCASATRGLVMGGMYAGIFNNTIEYVTIAQTGDSVDFGDLTKINVGGSALAGQTRGIFFEGSTGSPGTRTNGIDYVTISTLGNAAEFGDSTSVGNHRGTAANAVRGLTAGGITPSIINTIQFVTITTLGNALDFGDLVAGRAGFGGGCASRTRGVFGGGYTPSTTDAIDYVQIMSTGNAIDFGNLAASVQYAAGFSNGHGGL